MVKSSAWIERVKPDQPITKVARRAFRKRMKYVWYYAPRAAKQYQEEIEYVHQLRVGSRRARAALRIFGEMLPNSEARWIKKRLQELRRAAGDARDLDVLGARLAKISQERNDKRLEVVIEKIEARRKKVQKPLVLAYRKAKRKGFKERAYKLDKLVGWQGEGPEPTFAEGARRQLAPLVDEFFEAAEADFSDLNALHQMRIAGKRVRYAMELLAGAFEPSFRQELYPTFEEIQDKLGEINDHASAVPTLNEWFELSKSKKARAALAELSAEEEKQLEAKRQEFCQWWTSERESTLRTAFESYLTPTVVTAETEERTPEEAAKSG